MFTIVFSLFYSIRQGLRSRAVLQAEVLALRHQLLVLQRSNGSHRPRLSFTDRLLWVWLSQLWSGWRSALMIVKPETVIAWHRRGFHSPVLALEESSSTGSTLRVGGGNRPYSQDEPGQSALGSATHSWGTVEAG